MIWRMVDWGWIWVLAVCCCLMGSLKSYDQLVANSMTTGEDQSFLLVLKSDITAAENMALRGTLRNMKQARNIVWLSPKELITRIYRNPLTDEELEMVKQSLPRAVELMIPAQSLIHGEFDPQVFNTMPQIESFYWNDAALNSLDAEKARWALNIQQIKMGILLCSILIVFVAFLTATRRNRLRIRLERGGLSPESVARAGVADFYRAGVGGWLRSMLSQTIAAGLICLFLFLTANQVMALMSSSLEGSLASVVNWKFLWTCVIIAFIGKGLDLLRNRLYLERLKS